jgi:flagellar basal-body rod protein FlgG
MSIRGIANTAQSMAFYLRQQEVVTNNIANSATEAFKSVRLAAHIPEGGASPVPVEKTDLRQGVLRETQRPLDLAMKGSGYFVVMTEQGERLTRGGSFQLDGAARLTDRHGNPVLGRDGPIVIKGADAEVRADGTVVVDGTVAGRLRIETVEDPNTLRKEDAGRYIASTPVRAVALEEGVVSQGALEEPNMDPILSMVDLITIQRAYAANIDALRAMDNVLGTVVSEVGRVPGQ